MIPAHASIKDFKTRWFSRKSRWNLDRKSRWHVDLDLVSAACGNALDVVFILDSSGSIGARNFQKVKDFVISLVTDLDVEGGNIRIGAVTFDDTYVTSRHVESRHVTSRHVMSCHVMSRYVMSPHVKSRYVTS